MTTTTTTCIKCSNPPQQGRKLCTPCLTRQKLSSLLSQYNYDISKLPPSEKDKYQELQNTMMQTTGKHYKPRKQPTSILLPAPPILQIITTNTATQTIEIRDTRDVLRILISFTGNITVINNENNRITLNDLPISELLSATTTLNKLKEVMKK